MEKHITWQMVDEDDVLFTAYLPLEHLDDYEDMMNKLKGKGWEPVKVQDAPQRSPNGKPIVTGGPRKSGKVADGPRSKHWASSAQTMTDVWCEIKERTGWRPDEALKQVGLPNALKAKGTPEEFVASVLAKHDAQQAIEERAAKIDDQELRRSFLENVSANRELGAEWNKHRDDSIAGRE